MLKPPRATRPVLSMFGFTLRVTPAARCALPNFSLVHAYDLQVFAEHLERQGLLNFA